MRQVADDAVLDRSARRSPAPRRTRFPPILRRMRTERVRPRRQPDSGRRSAAGQQRERSFRSSSRGHRGSRRCRRIRRRGRRSTRSSRRRDRSAVVEGAQRPRPVRRARSLARYRRSAVRRRRTRRTDVRSRRRPRRAWRMAGFLSASPIPCSGRERIHPTPTLGLRPNHRARAHRGRRAARRPTTPTPEVVRRPVLPRDAAPPGRGASSSARSPSRIVLPTAGNSSRRRLQGSRSRQPWPAACGDVSPTPRRDHRHALRFWAARRRWESCADPRCQAPIQPSDTVASARPTAAVAMTISTAMRARAAGTRERFAADANRQTRALAFREHDPTRGPSSSRTRSGRLPCVFGGASGLTVRGEHGDAAREHSDRRHDNDGPEESEDDRRRALVERNPDHRCSSEQTDTGWLAVFTATAGTSGITPMKTYRGDEPVHSEQREALRRQENEDQRRRSTPSHARCRRLLPRHTHRRGTVRRRIRRSGTHDCSSGLVIRLSRWDTPTRTREPVLTRSLG